MKRRLLNLLNLVGGGSYSLLFGGLGIITLVCIARAFGLMETIELQTLDVFLRWRPAEATDEHITILEITEEDLQKQGIYPVSDSLLRDILADLKKYEPQVIGLDMFKDLPVPDPLAEDLESAQGSYQRLLELIRNSPEIVVIEEILDSPVSPPPDISSGQIGFVDLLIDDDGFYRTSLLASPNPNLSDNRYYLSFTLQVASRYLDSKGFELDNGIKDPAAVRFGDRELWRLKPNSGGYVDERIADVPVMLINFRSGEQPFNRLSLSQFLSGGFPKELIQDRIVLIGLTATSTKDDVNSAAVASPNPALVPGIDFQAHAISQIVNAVLEERPILRTWPTVLEYAWIIAWGLVGIGLIHSRRSIPLFVAIFIVLSIIPIALGYSLLFVGLWIPVFPAWLVFFLNSSSALLYRAYQYEQSQKIRLDERQRVIKRSYDAIHNGPLQTLKGLIRSSSSDKRLSVEELGVKLSSLDNQLRQIYEFMQLEHLEAEHRVFLTKGSVLDLNEPLHNLLYQVYRNKMMESAQYFKPVAKLPDFCPLNTERLSADDKEDIIRFLEEALCNVEQHATGVTRLTIVCKQLGNDNIVQVIDNGKSVNAGMDTHGRRGRGTKKAQALELSLGGHFSRQLQPSGGVVCTLTWPVHAPSIWEMSLRWLQSSAKWFDKGQL